MAELRLYDINGSTYQFREGEQPTGAVEHIEKKSPPAKSRTVANKSRKPADKAANDG